VFVRATILCAAISLIVPFPACSPAAGGSAQDEAGRDAMEVARASCDVYRRFVAEFSPHQRQFVFMAASVPEMPARRPTAPMEFRRGSGIFAPPPGPPSRRETFTADTSELFAQLQTLPSTNIADCFPEGQVVFSTATYTETIANFSIERERLYINREPPSPDQIISVWQVSPVAVSADGRRALMMGGFFCGGLCGGGAYYLFERQGDEWDLVGYRTAWIS
jgi:hypothetical protein